MQHSGRSLVFFDLHIHRNVSDSSQIVQNQSATLRMLQEKSCTSIQGVSTTGTTSSYRLVANQRAMYVRRKGIRKSPNLNGAMRPVRASNLLQRISGNKCLNEL
jgi:hypothetical protein